MQLKDIKTLLLGLTNVCNGRCLMCWHSNNVPLPRCELPIKIYEELRNNLFDKIEVLNLAGGGEVLQYSRIKEVFSDINRYNFKTIITSNFSCISDENRGLLRDMNVDFVVSLDGSTKKLQEFLRPNCYYDKIIDNIKFFKKHGKHITFQTTLSNYNFYDMANLISLAEELGVDVVKFQEYQILKNADKPYKLAKPPMDIDYLERISKKKYRVGLGIFLGSYHKPLVQIPTTLYEWSKLWRKMFVSKYCQNAYDILKVQENGIVMSCCVPYCKNMGDLNNSPLEEIIGSDYFESNRINCTCPMRFVLEHKQRIVTL